MRMGVLSGRAHAQNRRDACNRVPHHNTSHRQFAGFEPEAFLETAILFLPLPSFSSASRTCLNSCSDALSVRGNRRFSVSSVLTIAEPITTRANHLLSAG